MNAWAVLPVAGCLLVTAFGWGVTYSSMVSAQTQTSAQISAVISDVKDIRLQLPAIAQVQYEIASETSETAKNDKGLTEVNKRVDRVVDSFGTKLDTLVDKLNKLSTSVEVLSTQVNKAH